MKNAALVKKDVTLTELPTNLLSTIDDLDLLKDEYHRCRKILEQYETDKNECTTQIEEWQRRLNKLVYDPGFNPNDIKHRAATISNLVSEKVLKTFKK